MGQAPKIIAELKRTRDQIEAETRKFALDSEKGQLEEERDPQEELRPVARPTRVAQQTFD